MGTSIPRLAPWPQPSRTASCSSQANGSRPASGSRCARPTPASSSAGSPRQAPTRRRARSTPPSRRCSSRCPPTSAPRSSSRSWPGSPGGTTRSRRQISDEAGKPLKAARVETSRAMSTYTFAAVEARKLAGEMVPMDAAQAGEGKLAFTLRRPIGIVGAISPFNFPLNLVAHKLAPALAAGCAVVLKPASQTPLSALTARGARGGSRASGRLAERRRRAVRRDRRRARRGRAREGDHLHRLGRRRLGPEGTGAQEEGQPRARQRDAGDRHGRRRRRDDRGGDGRERVRLRGPELHLRPAHLRRAAGVRPLRRGVRPARARAEGRRPGRRGDRRRPGDRRRRQGADPRLDRGGEGQGRGDPDRRRGGRPDPADGDRQRRAPS